MEVKVDVVECGGVRRTMVLGWRWWRSLWCEDGRGGVGGSAWVAEEAEVLRDGKSDVQCLLLLNKHGVTSGVSSFGVVGKK
ncbi:hypothetical protein Tco_0015345 [Tanacetum coccineum]